MNVLIILIALLSSMSNSYKVFDVKDTDLSFSYSPNYNARNPIPKYNPNVVQNNDFVEMIKYYSWFASVGYCRNNMFSEGTCCPNMMKDWVVIDHNEYKGYNYVLLRSDKYQKFVYAFPGSRSFSDLVRIVLNSALIDTFGNNRDNKTVKYFKNRADEIRDMAFAWKNTQEIARYRGYQVIFTGHSLGGAVATIMSYYAAYFNYVNRYNNPTVLMTFGSPRPGNDVLATAVMNNVSVVYRVVRDGDMIATLPPCFLNIKGRCRTSLGITDDFRLNNSNGLFDIFKDTYNYWHVGGLVILNRQRSQMVFCNPLKAENYRDECKYSSTLNQDFHTYYFGNMKLSAKCQPQNSNDVNDLDDVDLFDYDE